MHQNPYSSLPVKVKYFLIKDRVDQKEITIEHCPTKQMWTDINTKQKQGTVFRVFRGHVMGIPADYNNASFATRCNFRPPDWIPEPVLMLPMPKDWVAMQECVGWDKKGPKLAATRPAAKVRFAVDMETLHTRTQAIKQNQQAPIKMMSGRALSPGINRALRLLGKTLDVAWERACICSLTSN